jgi:hypothetical protein
MARVGMHNWSIPCGHRVYRLDVDLAKNRSLLVVYEDGWQFINSTAHGAHALMVCAILLPIGLATLVIGAIRRREDKQADAVPQWIFTQHGPLPAPPPRCAAQSQPAPQTNQGM